MNNSGLDVLVMALMGLFGYLLYKLNCEPAPLLLGFVLGPMLEENFVTSMIKSDGSYLAFFERPIAGVLGVATLLVWLAPLLIMALRSRRAKVPRLG